MTWNLLRLLPLLLPLLPAAGLAQLAPAKLQPLVRQVGGLPGVRLSPVATEADAAGDRAARRQLLRAAYQDSLQQAQDVAAAIGLRGLQPLEVQLEGGGRPVAMRALAMADGAVPPFDPAELPGPMERLSLQVRFCARLALSPASTWFGAGSFPGGPSAGTAQ